ncbi:GNAT family N-acetyltransferase [Brenneria goodwinii]|uniref:GNAT family N-acetyltransferase n=1 Tax=Brenneria goodwinii TaxID=1109412 RepID=UPI0036F3A6D3
MSMQIVKKGDAPDIDWQALAALLRRAGLGDREAVKLKQAYQNSQFYWLGYAGNQIIATARAISDFTYASYLADVAISPEYQGRGYGNLLMNEIMATLSQYGKTFIYSVPDKIGFYKKYGYHVLETGMVYANPQEIERLSGVGYLAD